MLRKISYMLVAALPLVFLSALPVLAQDAPAAAAAGGSDLLGLAKALGAGLAIGLAVIGGTIGQSFTASAALEGIARNPSATNKIFTPFILGMALIESLVIFALLIAFLLLPQ